MNQVAIFYDHWTKEREGRPTFQRPLRLWKKVVWYKSNPRTFEYMSAVASERFPGIKVIQASRHLPIEARSARKLILLYPDSIGLGFSRIEREIAKMNQMPLVEVLNGRRRSFLLDNATKRALYLRRFLEWTMLVEFIVGATLVVTSPFLLLFDWARGRT